MVYKSIDNHRYAGRLLMGRKYHGERVCIYRIYVTECLTNNVSDACASHVSNVCAITFYVATAQQN